MGQRPHEGVDDGVQQFRSIGTRPPDGIADLLLVHPELGVFAGHIEPHRGAGIGVGPPNRTADTVEVQAGPQGVELGTEVGQYLDEHRRAERPGDAHELPVHPGEVCRKVFARPELREVMPVPRSGQAPYVVVRDVCNDIVHAPAGAHRGLPPG